MPRLTWYHTPWHPYALRLDDTVLSRRNLTAADLQAEIADLTFPDEVTRLTCCAPAGLDSTALSGAGFVPVARTHEVTLALPYVLDVDRTGLTFKWYDPTEAADWQAWYQAHWDAYARTHPLNPTRDPGPSIYEDIFGGDDLIAALFVYQDANFVGFSSLRDGEEIGWFGSVAGDTAHLSAILSETLRYASACGWRTATFEADDYAPALWSLSSHLSAASIARFIIWHRHVSDAPAAM